MTASHFKSEGSAAGVGQSDLRGNPIAGGPTPGKRHRPRGFLFSFAIVLFSALAAIVWLRLAPIGEAAVSDAGLRWVMDAMPSDEVVALKLQHARGEIPYDVGFFGNSRIIMVGAEELGIQGKRVFNFAVGGQSVRQSIRILEALQQAGKAPRLSVISMDHVELGLPGGAGALPQVPMRWVEAINDVRIASSREGARSGVIQAINSLSEEMRSAALAFNRVYVLSKLKAVAGLRGPATQFRGDGSRQESPVSNGVIASALPPRADTYPQLEEDLGRLSDLKKKGLDVIVYESPLEPALSAAAEKALSPKARDVRRRFFDACAKFKLVCHPAPLLAEGAWPDGTHAPAELIGKWLRVLVERRE